MKKLIYTIGIMMFLSGPLHPWVGQAAEEDSKDQSCNVLTDASCRLTSRIEYALRGSPNKGLNFGDSFGENKPEKVGQNLYLMIYKSTQTDTLSNAIKATAEQYGMPPERMGLILGGDISVILERAPLMRVEQAVEIYNQIMTTYQEKKDTLDLEASIKAKVEPNEMFADGDLANSGFDLINDLNNIEILLFKKNDLVTFGAAYDGGKDKDGKTATGAGSSAAGQAQSNAVNGVIPVDISLPVNAGSAGGGGNAAEEAPTNKPQNPFGRMMEDKSPILGGGINPNQCFANQELDRALDKFVENAAKNDKLKSTFTAESSAREALATVNSGGTNGTGSADLNIPVPTPANTSANKPPLTPAPPGDYSSPALCDDIICVSLEFISKPVVASFASSDNCINCHVQFINQALQKTISHNLIPAKASGNLGESGLCKRAAAAALGSIGMNVSFNVVPAITPAKNDLITLGNITDEWDKYAAQNGAWNYNEKKRLQLEAAKSKKPVNLMPIMSDLERMLIVEIANSPDGQTQANLIGKASESYAVQKLQEAQEMLTVEISKDAYNEVSTIQVLDSEMKQMNKFFEGFQKQFRTLLEDVPGLNSTKACIKLKEKKVCT
jgi:hypothetical protein